LGQGRIHRPEGAALADRNGVLLDVVVAVVSGAGADVVEGFGIFEPVLLAEFAAAAHDEFADVVAVGGDVVAVEKWEALALFGEVGFEAAA